MKKALVAFMALAAVIGASFAIAANFGSPIFLVPPPGALVGLAGEKPFPPFSFCVPVGRGGVCGGRLVQGSQRNPRELPGRPPGGPYAFKIQMGGFLPLGLVLNPRSGVVSGTVSAQAHPKRWAFTICTSSTSYAPTAKTAGSTCRPTAIDVQPNFEGAWTGRYHTTGNESFNCTHAPLDGDVQIKIDRHSRERAFASVSYTGTSTFVGLNTTCRAGVVTRSDLTETISGVADGVQLVMNDGYGFSFTAQATTLSGALDKYGDITYTAAHG